MKRVLVVDDEVDSLTLLELYLAERGFHVQTADTGRLAVELGRETPPDVLITDYLLRGELSGIDVIRSLRERRPNLPALLFTGMSRADLQSEIEQLPDVTVLQKPLTLTALEQAVREAG